MIRPRQGWIVTLLLPLCLAFSGCGFHPLYGSADQAAEANLPDIFVATIAGRPGQLLRQALQEKLAGGSEAQPQGYTLRVAYGQNDEAIGIHGDNTSSRTRVIGSATWTLSSVADAPVILTSGIARSDDGFSVVDTQYFAAIMAGESTNRRVADNLSDTIRTQLAVWFTAHPNGAVATTEVAKPLPMPPAAPQNRFLQQQNIPGNSDQSPLQQVSPDGLPQSAIGRTSP